MTANLDLIRGRQQVIPMTNKSGGACAEGEVVVVDETTDDAFTTTNDEGKKEVVGIVAEAIANNAEGRIICSGYAPVLEVDAATARGDWLKTADTDPGKATPTADPAEGSFAIALSAVGAAGQVSAFVFPGGSAILAGSGGAWTLIEDVELGAPAATIDFQNIPDTYKHLVIEYSLRTDRAAEENDAILLRFNNSAVGYDYLRSAIYHNAQLASAEGLNASAIEVDYAPAATGQANSFSSGSVRIHDYTDGSRLPTALTQNAYLRTRTSGKLYVGQSFGQWRTQAVVSRITLLPEFGTNFVAGSRATLYGIS